MTGRAVLDTTVLIDDHFNNDWSGELAISAASLAELHFGVLSASDDISRARRLTRLAAVQERFPHPLPFDAGVAPIWADLARQTRRAGKEPRRRYFDLLIAATAMANQAALITANVKDFQHLESLALIQSV